MFSCHLPPVFGRTTDTAPPLLYRAAMPMQTKTGRSPERRFAPDRALVGHDRMGDAERFRLVSAAVMRIMPVLSFVEGPVLSFVEGPVLSFVEGPVLSFVEGPVLSFVEGPVLSPVEAGRPKATF